jgi:hypothetical protein
MGDQPDLILEQLVARFGNPAELNISIGREKAWPLREGKVISPKWIDKLETALNEPDRLKGTVSVKRGDEKIYVVSNGTVDIDEREALEILTQLESLPEQSEPSNVAEVQPVYLELLNSRLDRVGQESWTLDELRTDVEQGRAESGVTFINTFDDIVIREGLERNLSREQTLAVLEQSPTVEGLAPDEVARYRTQFEDQYNSESARFSGVRETTLVEPEPEAVQETPELDNLDTVNPVEENGFPEDLPEDESLSQDEGIAEPIEFIENESIEPEESALSYESAESLNATLTALEPETVIEPLTEEVPEQRDAIAANSEQVIYPSLEADFIKEPQPLDASTPIPPVIQSDQIPSDFGLAIAQGYDMDAAKQIGGAAPREYAALDGLRTQLNDDRARLEDGADWLQDNPAVLANETRYAELRSTLESRLAQAAQQGRWTPQQTVSFESTVPVESTQEAVSIPDSETAVIHKAEPLPETQAALEWVPLDESVRESSPDLISTIEKTEEVPNVLAEAEDSWNPMTETEIAETDAMIETRLADHEIESEELSQHVEQGGSEASFYNYDPREDWPTDADIEAWEDRSIANYAAQQVPESSQNPDIEMVLSNEPVPENKPDLATAPEPIAEALTAPIVAESVAETIPAQTVEPNNSVPFQIVDMESQEGLAQITASINQPLDVPLDPESQQAALAEHFSFPPEALNQADVFNGAFAAAELRLQSLQDGFATVEFELKNLAQHIGEGKFPDWASTQSNRVGTAAQSMTETVKGRFSQWVDNAKTTAKSKVQEAGQTLMDKFEKAVALVDSDRLERIAPILPSQVDNYRFETDRGLRILRDGASIYENGKCTPNINTSDSVFIRRLSERAEKHVSSMVDGLATLGGDLQPNGDRAFSVGTYTMSRAENGAVKLSEASRGEILHAQNGKIRSSLTAEDFSRFRKFHQNTQVAVKAPAMAKGGIELG